MTTKSVIGSESGVNVRVIWFFATDLSVLSNFVILNDLSDNPFHLSHNWEISASGICLLYVAEAILNECENGSENVKRHGRYPESDLFFHRVASGRYLHGRIDLLYQSFLLVANVTESARTSANELCHCEDDHPSLIESESG